MLNCFAITVAQNSAGSHNELHRPQIHFSPLAHWINDPNGMIYFKGTYHLFYQYYPDGTVWGPMHWGHATSTDLFHWKQLPIALFPDSLGYIFSGSAVADSNNTSGFGRNGRIPLVAIFTQHDPKGEKEGATNFQNQSIAYSLDDGKTWVKYNQNPVLKNPGIKDFRDPKVSWYAPAKKWIMTLATLDHITFFESKDLKQWSQISEFGKTIGAHGGVWECPDLFPINYEGKSLWVLIININPGAINGGSGTQYFIGSFDGKVFTPFETDTRWLDYGPDDYAGVTWSNTGKRHIFLGWMGNWLYANKVPTDPWRGAMTIPRELKIEKINRKYSLTSLPLKSITSLSKETLSLINIKTSNFDLSSKIKDIKVPFQLDITTGAVQDFRIKFSNSVGEELVVGFDKALNQFFIDRSNSGDISFDKNFANKSFAPRLSNEKNISLKIIADNSSLELFADNGSTVMTCIFFPHKNLDIVHINSADVLLIKKLKYTAFGSIFK